jgi:uncharacterized membrane protein
MVESSHTRSGNSQCNRSRSASTQKWGALIGGGALAIYGITRRSPLGLILAASGGTIALLSATQQQRSSAPSAWTSLLVNCSREDAYKFWRDFDNFPLFMNRLESVTKLDERRSRWVALGPGKRIRWEAEITEERENEYIAWRSLQGSDVQVDGRVEFKEAPAGRGTLISARMEFSSLPGMNKVLAKFLSKGASFAMRQDLRRLEALLEAGEIPTVEGQSHGPRDRVTGLLRSVDPTRPIRPKSSLKDVYAQKRSIA